MVVPDIAVPSRPYAPRSRAGDWTTRLTRCIAGLGIFGLGDAMILRAELGAAPWDMLHQGISDKTGVSIGLVLIATSIAVLLLWIPLRQRPGIGTILNAIEIGGVVYLVLDHLPDSQRLVVRGALLVGGLLLVAIGSGLYIGAGLGAGPRDGLMIGLSTRGISVRLARTAVEFAVGVGGILLGARPGIGTVVFMFGIGPLVQWVLPWFTLPPFASTAPRRGAEAG